MSETIIQRLHGLVMKGRGKPLPYRAVQNVIREGGSGTSAVVVSINHHNCAHAYSGDAAEQSNTASKWKQLFDQHK